MIAGNIVSWPLLAPIPVDPVVPFRRFKRVKHGKTRPGETPSCRRPKWRGAGAARHGASGPGAGDGATSCPLGRLGLTPGLNPANSTLHGCFIHHLEMGFPAIYITKPPWHGSHAGFQVWESESPTGYLSVRSFQKYESQKENHHDRM